MKKRTISCLLFALLPLAAAALLILGFFTDNKYYGASAPIENGEIVLDGDGVFSLTDGWAVFEGLLTPRETLLKTPAATGVRLGGEPNFSAYLGEPYGAVTYRAAISGNGEISLYFPEVLSAYRVYLGDEPIGGAGGLGGDYRAYVKDKIYTVTLRGTTFLTVQVENRAALYGGLYFPPLAGGRDAVADAVGLRFSLYTGFAAAIAALLVLSVPFLVFSRVTRKYFVPFGALCLFTGISLFLPLSTAAGTGSVNFVYVFQNAAAAAAPLAALALTARVGSFENRRHYRFAALPAAIGLTLFATVLTAISPAIGGAVSATGYLISAWKAGLSLYLLALSVRAFVKTRAPREALTLAATASYAICLLFSVASIGFFEPIRGFFPEELGAICATLAFAALLVSESVRTTRENERLNRKLSAEVEKKTAAVFELLEDRKRLIGNLTHDLKTPITAVRAYAELVGENETLDGESKRALSVMVARLDDFNERVRLLERFNKGESPSEFEPVELNAFLSDFYRKHVGEAELSGARLVLDLPGETLTVSGDRSKLERMVENLAYNALSYTEPGGKITVSLSREAGDAAIRVTDAGAGIAPEDLPRVFDPYFSKRSETGDRGLGLYIAKLVATEHLGSIEAASLPRVKTTFTVRLPLVR